MSDKPKSEDRKMRVVEGGFEATIPPPPANKRERVEIYASHEADSSTNKTEKAQQPTSKTGR